MERASGVLMHISSLFGDYSAGSFGDEAKYFIDFLAESGFSYWQVETDIGEINGMVPGKGTYLMYSDIGSANGEMVLYLDNFNKQV